MNPAPAMPLRPHPRVWDVILQLDALDNAIDWLDACGNDVPNYQWEYLSTRLRRALQRIEASP